MWTPVRFFLYSLTWTLECSANQLWALLWSVDCLNSWHRHGLWPWLDWVRGRWNPKFFQPASLFPCLPDMKIACSFQLNHLSLVVYHWRIFNTWRLSFRVKFLHLQSQLVWETARRGGVFDVGPTLAECILAIAEPRRDSLKSFFRHFPCDLTHISSSVLGRGHSISNLVIWSNLSVPIHAS